MFCISDNYIFGMVMEFETFGYCYVLVFGMEMELVTVINFLLLLSGLVFHYCNISTYYFP